MKFWKRIFIYSMILFLLLFNSAGIFIIENMHKRSVDRTVKAALDEHKGIEGILYLNSDSLQVYKKSFGNDITEWLSLVITGYVFNDKIESNYIEIYDDNNKQIFSNSENTLEFPREELEEAKVNERLFIIRRVKDLHFLYISSKVKIQENTLKLVLVQNIEFIYSEKFQNYKLFIILDCFVSLVLAIGMYLISKKLTKPIEELTEASKEITRGNYTKRVSVKNKSDEIGILEKNFNIMIQATEENIKQLEDMNNAKQRFIDSLTHELKTPLTSIIGYSDLLLKGNVNEEIRLKSLSYINSEAVRLERLSLALLKLTLINQEELSFNDISLKACVLSASKTLSYKIESKNINFKINVSDSIIKGDLQLLNILLINFLDNAIKASTDSAVIEIWGDYSSDNKQYILEIRDYGVGIPEDDLNKIKEPFYVVDKSRSRANGGVGLGLAICDQICKLYNIELEINSRVNEGTSVRLRFSKENDLL